MQTNVARPLVKSSKYRLHKSPVSVVRFPALPVDVADRLLSSLAWEDDLRSFVHASPQFRTALRIASPSLHGALEGWLEGLPVKNPRFTAKLLLYVLRMSTRPTPFGQFSAVGEVGFGEACSASVAPEACYTRTKANLGWFSAWVQSIVEDQAALDQLPVVVNETYTRRGERLRVVNVAMMLSSHGSTAEFQTSHLYHTDGVDFVIRHSGTPLGELRRKMAETFEVDETRIADFILQLRRAGLIAPPLPLLPVGDPVETALRVADAVVPERSAAMREALSSMDAFDLIPVADRTKEDVDKTEQILAGQVAPETSALHIDMYHPHVGEVPARLVADIARFAEASLRMRLDRDDLSAYRDAFITYSEGLDAHIPLMDFVEKVATRVGQPAMMGSMPRQDVSRDRLLTQIVTQCLRSGSIEYELSAQEYDILLPEVRDRPRSIETAFRISAPSPVALEDGDYRIIPSQYHGCNRTARSLGRFLEGLGSNTLEKVSQALSEEAGPLPRVELVYAISRASVINMCLRPRLLDHELQIGLMDNAEGVTRLAASDISVGMRDGRLYLWSESLGSQIELQESHLLTHVGAPPLFTFLKTFVKSGGGPGDFRWGAASGLHFFPRLQFDRIVLTPATWRIDIKAFRDSENPLTMLQRFAEEWNLPDDVIVVNGIDRYVPMRLSSPSAWAILDAGVADPEMPVELVEFLGGFESGWLVDENGHRFVGEMVVSLLRDDAGNSEIQIFDRATKPVDRQRSPSSDWVYYRCECDPVLIDEIVGKTFEFVDSLRRERVLDKWFFVRYSDPTPHVRLRYKATEGHEAILRERTLAHIDSLQEQGFCDEYSIETYSREVERYGGAEGIILAEDAFAIDTGMVFSGLAGLQDGKANRGERAVLDALPLLGAFFRNQMDEWLNCRHVVRAKLSKGERAMVKRLTASSESTRLWGDTRFDECASEYRRLEKEGKLARPIVDIASALLHMHFNRYGNIQEDGARRIIGAFLRSKQAC